MLKIKKIIKSFYDLITPNRNYIGVRKNQKDYYKLLNFLDANSTFLDLGANIGEVSNYVNNHTKGCNIICYEPHPEAFSQLEKRFRNFKNIELHNMAVSTKNKQQKLYLHEDATSEFDLEYSQGSSLDPKKINIDETKVVNVKTKSIDVLLDDFDYIDCVKIDIEGHEYEILPCIIKNRKKVGKVICELHGKTKNPHLSDAHNLLVNKLKSLKLYDDWFLEWH